MKKVRLSDRQIDIIKKYAVRFFGKNVKVYIFGSRADLSKKGGDIDILVITDNLNNLSMKKLKFVSNLMRELGEQKIDVIITDKPKKPIEIEAFRTGVEL